MMKKILCPTDFSATSNNAITYAAKLAQATNSELTLLNVQSLFEFTPVEFVTGKQFTLKATGERLQAQCREVSNVFKISCTAEVEPTYHKLSSVIRDKSHLYDLIVMGSNGPDDLYQFLFGTHTYHALEKTHAPLLLIRDGTLYTAIKKIVFAFDYLKERKLPADPLLKFAKSLKSDVIVLQVMEEAYSEAAEVDLKELQIILKSKLPENSPITFETIRSSNISKSIDSYVRKHEPDILALCTKDRNVVEKLFHKSIIRDISTVCNYPLLLFHN
ncbi:MAG TPA: universal stress protein [Chryseosolibacter sp.]|nr:universal stress protein [Chryseosolibacter sp.]